ncbi:MAG: hypothetical protein HC837_18905 [Chloroflexaceae bacterium]|nr:hypothetical protein [Chloroflexaceae bacterium]
MVRLSLGFGIGLIALGVLSYIVTGMTSLTALIPSAFGLVIAGLGFAARREAISRYAHYAAAGVALIGFIATVSSIPKAFALAAGGSVERPGATVIQLLMAITCVVFVVLSIRALVAARRDPEQQ